MTKNFSKCSVFGCTEIATCKCNRDGNLYCRPHYQSITKWGHPYGSQNMRSKIYLPDSRYPDDCCAIKTNSGQVFIFDVIDLPIARFYDWNCSEHTKYATTRINGSRILMHRLIKLGTDYNSEKYKKIVIDHKNNNTHDNRRCNLRLASYLENARNKESYNIKIENGKFRVIFTNYNKVIFTNIYSTLEEAVQVRDNMRSELYGDFDFYKYTDDSVFIRKLELILEYDKAEKARLNNPNATPAFYVNRETYKSVAREYLNLPTPMTNILMQNGVRCSICGDLAFTNYKGQPLCERHLNSYILYGQPFGFARNKNSLVNTKIKNFNNTGFSVLIIKDYIAIFDAEYSDLVFKYNWRCSIYEKGRKPVTMIIPDETGKTRTLANLLFIQKYPEIENMDKNVSIEFKNGNQLDFRMENLVYSGCTPMSRSIVKGLENSKNGKFRGVYVDYYNGRVKGYTARIFYNKDYLYIGQYKTFEEAVQARLDAERKYYGETFEEIEKRKIIYDTLIAQVKEYLNKFDPNVQTEKPFYYTTEDPSKYPEYLDKMRQNAAITVRDYINSKY